MRRRCRSATRLICERGKLVRLKLIPQRAGVTDREESGCIARGSSTVDILLAANVGGHDVRTA
jgi:hypothetical protein